MMKNSIIVMVILLFYGSAFADYCTKCGSNVNENWQFCKKCGTKTEGSTSKNDDNSILKGDIDPDILKNSIPSSDARDIIEKTSSELVMALQKNDFEKISSFVHPDKGVMITLYATYFDPSNDKTMSAANIKNALNDNKTYELGYSDGVGPGDGVPPITLTIKDYFAGFKKTDFSSAKFIEYNSPKQCGDMKVKEIYKTFKNPIIVVYCWPCKNIQENAHDWHNTIFVFEMKDYKWYLVSIQNDCWTI